MTHSNDRAPRYRVRGLNVIYDTGQEFWSGPVVNASASGLFIETTHSLPIGSKIVILPDGWEDERLPFEVVGEVVRVNELNLDEHWDRTPGIAMQFVGLSDDEMEQLHQFLTEYGVIVGVSAKTKVVDAQGDDQTGESEDQASAGRPNHDDDEGAKTDDQDASKSANG